MPKIAAHVLVLFGARSLERDVLVVRHACRRCRRAITQEGSAPPGKRPQDREGLVAVGSSRMPSRKAPPARAMLRHTGRGLHGTSGRALAFVLGLSAAAPLLGGCAAHVAAAAARVPKAAVPAVVNASLASLEDPATRGRMAAIAGTPEMQQVVRGVSRSAVEGVLANPMFQPAALRRTLRDGAADATRAALRVAADETPRTLAPALRSSIVDSLAAPDLRDAVAMTASDATRAALRSSFDVLKQLHEEEGIPQLIATLQRLLAAIVIGALVVGMALAALLVWALSVNRRARRLARQIDQGRPPDLREPARP